MPHRSWRRRRCDLCWEKSSWTISSGRETLNVQLQDILDQQTDVWGIKVSLVEIKDVDLPQEMRRAMSKQAEAEREKRAKIIHADGEYQAAEKLVGGSGLLPKSRLPSSFGICKL